MIRAPASKSMASTRSVSPARGRSTRRASWWPPVPPVSSTRWIHCRCWPVSSTPAVQTFVGPIDDLLQDAGQSPLSQSLVDSLLSLSGYDLTNELDASLLTTWTDSDGQHPVAEPGRHLGRVAVDLRAAAGRPCRLRLRHFQLLRRLSHRGALSHQPLRQRQLGMHCFSGKTAHAISPVARQQGGVTCAIKSEKALSPRRGTSETDGMRVLHRQRA